MPLYEYHCEACGHRFEVIRKFSDPPLETCVKCGVTGKVQKLLSSPAFQFKGSGWYVTDYAKKSGDAGSPAGKSETKTESSTESKPDTAKETTTPADKAAPAAAPASTSTSKDK